MPTNFDEGTPRDPNVRKQIDKLYRANSAPESNTYQASRKRLESSFRAEPSARPEPQISKQTFIENIHSRSRPKGYEDKATEARQQARREYLQRTGQIQEIARGARNPTNFTPKASPTTVVNPPTSTPRPAIPGASLASGVASLGIGFLIDRYATPYLMDKAQRAGGFLGANLAYKRGKISEFELEQALATIRNGNPTEWGQRINEIRRTQEVAKLGKNKQTSSKLGGQETGVKYNVTLQITYKFIADRGQTVTFNISHDVIGPVLGSTIIYSESGGTFGVLYGSPFPDERNLRVGNAYFEGYENFTRAAVEPVNHSITSIRRTDGKPDISSSTNTKPIIPSTIRNSSTTKSQTPKTTDKIPEINKAKPNSIIIPAGFPIGVSGNDKTVQVIPSTTSPSTVEIPHPRTQEPKKPDEEKKVPPLTISNPSSPNIKLETSGSGPVTINIPGYNPITVTPGTNKPQGALPIQDINRQYQPVAKPGTTPTPSTPTTPGTTKPATTEDLDQFKKDLEKLILTGGLLAGLTPAIQTISDRVNQTARQTTPEALETAAAAGTCRTTQPGGCTTKALDDAVGRINQNSNNNANALDAANALANATQVGMLQDITNRIGAQLPGGLAGKLSRFVNWAVVDRVTNIITMFAALHNVMMLSNSVKETFLDVLDNLLQTGYNIAPNIFKQADEDSAIDAREYIGKATDKFFGGLFGIGEWTVLKAQWKAYSTIYSSSAQAYNNLRELHNDAQELLNMTRNYTAELGNALVDEGVISEENWQHKDDKKKIKSKVLGKLQRMGQGLEDLDNKLEAIEQVTSLLLNITNTAKEIKENIEAIDKGVKDANDAAKKDRDAKIEGLELPNFSLDDIF